MDASSPPLAPSPKRVPPRPVRRPPPPRAATFCFWSVLVLFVAALCYLGLLAFAANAGLFFSAGSGSHFLIWILVAIFAAATVAVGVAARHHHNHHHHRI